MTSLGISKWRMWGGRRWRLLFFTTCFYTSQFSLVLFIRQGVNCGADASNSLQSLLYDRVSAEHECMWCGRRWRLCRCGFCSRSTP